MNTLEMPPIVTYRAINPPKSAVAWIANFYNTARGEIVQFSFAGSTEDEAITKAEEWWRTRNFTGDIVMTDDETQETEKAEKPKSLKGAVFVGKIWVCHVSQPSKRIDESELAAYEAKGYMRGKKFGYVAPQK